MILSMSTRIVPFKIALYYAAPYTVNNNVYPEFILNVSKLIKKKIKFISNFSGINLKIFLHIILIFQVVKKVPLKYFAKMNVIDCISVFICINFKIFDYMVYSVSDLKSKYKS